MALSAAHCLHCLSHCHARTAGAWPVSAMATHSGPGAAAPAAVTDCRLLLPCQKPQGTSEAACLGRLSNRLMFFDKPPPAFTEASISMGSHVAGPTRLYSNVLLGPLPRTACTHLTLFLVCDHHTMLGCIAWLHWSQTFEVHDDINLWSFII